MIDAGRNATIVQKIAPKRQEAPSVESNDQKNNMVPHLHVNQN